MTALTRRQGILDRLQPVVPAQVIDLRNFSLALPIPGSGSPYAKQVYQPQLATFSLNPDFVANTSRSAVLFEANCGGATTSGTNYPRSELREQYNSGVSAANWSTTNGLHTMTVTGAILALPPVKPQTVFGQIHDGSMDIIELLADGTKSGTTPGAIMLMYRYLGSEQSTPLDPNYTLGTTYTYSMSVNAAALISIHYNGALIDTQTYSDTGCYFKAGAYTQSNVAHGDAASAYSETQISNISISHTPLSSVDPTGSVTNAGCGTGYQSL